ncbi:MAG: ATP-dependent DNA helicase DinG [Planctomycetota bacterium]|jgi:ATP-dependent DNA helicase DinG
MVRSPLDPAETPGWTASGRLAFVVLWTSGSDPELDAPLRMLALRGCSGDWAWFDAWCKPANPEPVSARVRASYGVTAPDLEDGESPEDVWQALLDFLGDTPVLAPEAELFRSWRRSWAQKLGDERAAAPVLGLDELAALIMPGRVELAEGGLVRTLGGVAEGPPKAFAPTDLAAALDALVRPLLTGDPRARELAVLGLSRARHAFLATDPEAARTLGLALSILDKPALWAGASGELFGASGSLPEGVMTEALQEARSADLALESLRPASAERFEDWINRDDLPPGVDGLAPFHKDDHALLEDIMSLHLPAVLAGEFGGDPAAYQRESQHKVAREVAATMGSDELLLTHAPTGTGKTLGYLLPALLWSRRNNVRVGIATYTRALQEQAMQREVPRALAALARAGVPPGSLVSVLKGRENYLCWRALRACFPETDEDGESWLAWTGLVLFALRDPEGDLDRMSARPPLSVASGLSYRRAYGNLLRTVRAQTSCCSTRTDRDTCSAEIARRRAERSHLVITNHSFVLARQKFFQHLIFDECEHLHDQAASAWSHRTTFRGARDVLLRLHRPRSLRGRAPFDRLARQLLEGTPSGDALGRAMGRWQAAADALGHLEGEAGSFNEWREETAEGRSERELHGLFREFLDLDRAAGLIAARVDATGAMAQLESALDYLGETIENLPLRSAKRIRRALEVGRGELVVLNETLAAWLPLDEGRARIPREAFHDVESTPEGDLALVARVLLPQEVLGRFYFPQLGSAVFLSATTWLRGGFGASKDYLGLTRAEKPGKSEERIGRAVRTFRASEVFDYSRVLVGVPRDAPPPAQKARHLDYVTRFVEWLSQRTRGRTLVLFTNREDVRIVGERLTESMAKRHLPLYWQGMPQAAKEELSSLFRERTDSILLGVDTFWYGADFPGETLEYLVMVRLPYGVPDRYHHAQCAAIGDGPQRAGIYQPRALAKFRQGFGRLMRRTSDRGCVFVLDPRILDPRHRIFLRELPLGLEADFGKTPASAARLVRGDTSHIMREAFAHMGLMAELERRGLSAQFEGDAPAPVQTQPLAAWDIPQPERKPRPEPPGPLHVDPDELPY